MKYDLREVNGELERTLENYKNKIKGKVELIPDISKVPYTLKVILNGEVIANDMAQWDVLHNILNEKW